jgi:hypothetical protein
VDPRNSFERHATTRIRGALPDELAAELGTDTRAGQRLVDGSAARTWPTPCSSLPERLRGGAHSGLNPRSGNRFA